MLQDDVANSMTHDVPQTTTPIEHALYVARFCTEMKADSDLREMNHIFD